MRWNVRYNEKVIWDKFPVHLCQVICSGHLHCIRMESAMECFSGWFSVYDTSRIVFECYRMWTDDWIALHSNVLCSLNITGLSHIFHIHEHASLAILNHASPALSTFPCSCFHLFLCFILQIYDMQSHHLPISVSICPFFHFPLRLEIDMWARKHSFIFNLQLSQKLKYHHLRLNQSPTQPSPASSAAMAFLSHHLSHVATQCANWAALLLTQLSCHELLNLW